MFHTLLIGLGRSGRELHLPVLRRLRADRGTAGAGDTCVFAPDDPLGYDIRPAARRAEPGLRTVGSLAGARDRLDPATTVVHLCSPPTERTELLRDIAGLGFRRFLVEKPIGVDTVVVEELRTLRDSYGLQLAVVAPWLHSTLTERLDGLVRSGSLGHLRRIDIRQHKPRLHRSLHTPSHPTAFDVELPHSVGVVLRLAGAARVTGATCTDARVGDTVVPRMGSAAVTLDHDSGVTSRIATDLASPLRERRIDLVFDAGTAVGHYPVGSDDLYAHLRVTPIGLPERYEIFPDAALDACILHAYRGFRQGADRHAEFTLQAQVVEVLEQAKRHAAGRTAERSSTHVLGR
ncbi:MULTISPECIES: Gfo/Idh/MocA family oxidoreductase [Streptomyces]|uniref:hypothetical protein n=1 Tax=Streptomyces TaxID=1883 RepID=UPI00163BAC13|nr:MULTISPECIES: hypothetical protein [Streptomyces]MBC2878820.1 hypothetical protein [Streptomyces sp. TYQ1024]UBI39264.1 hypothetical protein K7I03_24255 [Streptomyces mobaraensis]UKW31845.1 hypothetical protein MCU78_24195 [Streptomyces sp. TYQ1024]